MMDIACKLRSIVDTLSMETGVPAHTIRYMGWFHYGNGWARMERLKEYAKEKKAITDALNSL